MKRVWLLIAAMALAAVMTAGCVTTKYDDGSSETDLLGFIPIYGIAATGESWVAPGVRAALPWWANILIGAGSIPAVGALGSKRVRSALRKGHIATAVGWKHTTTPPEQET